VEARRAPGKAVPDAVTMRTPGAEFDLAAGFTESLLNSAGDLASIACSSSLEERRSNVMPVRLHRPFEASSPVTTSSVSAHPEPIEAPA
jgi:formate dehydrogenase assembly factor FdhD